METPFTTQEIQVRQNLWLFAQGEGDDTLTLTREEGKALWHSILLAGTELCKLRDRAEEAEKLAAGRLRAFQNERRSRLLERP